MPSPTKVTHRMCTRNQLIPGSPPSKSACQQIWDNLRCVYLHVQRMTFWGMWKPVGLGCDPHTKVIMIRERLRGGGHISKYHGIIKLFTNLHRLSLIIIKSSACLRRDSLTKPVSHKKVFSISTGPSFFSGPIIPFPAWLVVGCLTTKVFLFFNWKRFQICIYKEKIQACTCIDTIYMCM